MIIRAGIRGLVLAAALAGAGAAYAHAHLDRASPAAGATLAVAPTEVTLHFTQQLEPNSAPSWCVTPPASGSTRAIPM
jgi:methionine-rich copper-binding protein CopC